jgi:hypothetical protein
MDKQFGFFLNTCQVTSFSKFSGNPDVFCLQPGKAFSNTVTSLPYHTDVERRFFLGRPE